MGLDGDEQERFGAEGTSPGQLRFPQAVASCPGRWVAVADLGNHQVVRFDWSGRHLGSFAPEPAGPKKPPQIVHIEVSADCGRMYVVDSKGSRVLVTTPEGEVLQTLASW